MPTNCVLCGNPSAGMKLSPATDPRIDPRMLRVITKLGIDQLAPGPLLNFDKHEFTDIMEMIHSTGKAQEDVHRSIVEHETGTGVSYSLERAQSSSDSFQIDLHIHRPADQRNKALPAILILHGGALVMFGAYSPLYRRWAHDPARQGLVAINVAFRNAVGDDKRHNPFPTGLNDCVSAVRWIHQNRARLGIEKIIIQGESGGANLAIATTMKLLHHGDDKVIDGVYAISPYVSGAYAKGDHWKLENCLSSLIELDGYLLTSGSLANYAAVYDPSGENAQNPLAWPWYGSQNDFKTFPPTIITVDELDPLRDEGLAVARKMAEAGVRVNYWMNMGMMHTAAIWQAVLPHMYSFAMSDIKGFANEAGR